jgi:hypothetical protein
MKRWLIAVGMVALFGASVAMGAENQVNLEWRVKARTCHVGDSVYVGLYAVGDEQDEAFALAAVIVNWDPKALEFCGVIDDGPYTWMFSGFPPDYPGDGLNNDLVDGDAFYQAWPPLDWPEGQGLPVATAEGLRLTTFEFRALNAGATTIEILPEYGTYSTTAVYDDQYGGWNIVGDTGSVTVTVQE